MTQPPVFKEGKLQVQHCRTLDLDMGIAPAVRLVLVSNVQSTDPADLAIAITSFSVVAKVQLEAVNPAFTLEK